MKISFFEIEGWEEAIIKNNFPADKIYLNREKIDQFSLFAEKDFDAISVFVDSRINEAVLKTFPNLKFITTRSTGYDHIDLNACKKRNILVGFVPGYGNNTVAEWAFGLILNLTRKIYLAIDQIKEQGSFDQTNLRGIDLKGRILGVIGTGRIGKEAIKIGQGFGMNVIAYDPFPDLDFQKEKGFNYVSLEDLLKNSDIVTIHTLYNEKTHHLINKNNINLIKKGSYLVNTARGGIVETEAVVEALKNGILAGFGADVLEEEGEVKDEMNFLARTGSSRPETLRNILYNHVLMKMPNVLITPHNAFNSQEALERILNTTIENIKGFEANNLNPKNIAK